MALVVTCADTRPAGHNNAAQITATTILSLVSIISLGSFPESADTGVCRQPDQTIVVQESSAAMVFSPMRHRIDGGGVTVLSAPDQNGRFCRAPRRPDDGRLTTTIRPLYGRRDAAV
jgi:hypothetical protein